MQFRYPLFPVQLTWGPPLPPTPLSEMCQLSEGQGLNLAIVAFLRAQGFNSYFWGCSGGVSGEPQRILPRPSRDVEVQDRVPKGVGGAKVFDHCYYGDYVPLWYAHGLDAQARPPGIVCRNGGVCGQAACVSRPATPNLPTKIIPTEIR